MTITINDQLFLETVLIEITANTISFASFTKRQAQDNDGILKKEIESLELKYEENINQLQNCKIQKN